MPTSQRARCTSWTSSTVFVSVANFQNGPTTGLTAKTLAKFGSGSDSQEALDLVGFAQSASTGAHVGGRFYVPIMQKMDKMLNMNMNDEQFLAAEQGIRDVMQPYAESGGRITVGEYQHNLIGSVQVLKDGRKVKVTGFDKSGNIVGTQVRQRANRQLHLARAVLPNRINLPCLPTPRTSMTRRRRRFFPFHRTSPSARWVSTRKPHKKIKRRRPVLRQSYQQTKEQAQAHIVQNANEDVANPFSDTTPKMYLRRTNAT